MPTIGGKRACALLLLTMLLSPAAAASDPRQMLATYRSFAAAQAAVLDRLRENLAEKRGLEAKYKALDAESANKDREIEEANAFCKGTFEEAEYRRRLKACQEKQRKLDAVLGAIAKIRAKLDEQDAARRTKAAVLKNEYTALSGRTKAIEAEMAESPAFADAMDKCAAHKGLAERVKCVAENRVRAQPGKADYLLDALSAGTGNWEKSIADLEARVATDPGNVSARDALSFLRGLYEGHLALSGLQNVRYKRGVLAWMEGDYRDAALHFAESYELDPTDKGALGAYGFVSGLDQAQIHNSAYAPCHLISECDSIAHAREFGIRISSPAAYRLMSDEERNQLDRLRLEVTRNPEDLTRRAALNYADGLSAWDDFRDREKKDGEKIHDLPAMTDGIINMGRGNYRKALASFARGLDEDWGEDGLTFSYFHAMGLNEGTRGEPGYTPRIWDERTSKIYADFYRDELRALQGQSRAGRTPPWIYARKALRREETRAWSRFLADPFEPE